MLASPTARDSRAGHLCWPLASRRGARLAACAVAFVIEIPLQAQGPADPPLSTAAAVLSLSGEQAAQRLPVAVTGVVTAAEVDWKGQFFLQDETAGVFVENFRLPGPRPGDVVRVAGISHPGAFAPIISAPEWETIGSAPLPVAKPVLIENLEAGVEDGMRVEVTGVVRTVRSDTLRTTLELAVGGYRLQVCAPPLSVGRPEALVAARVRVRGTCATHYNAALRHLTSVGVYVPTWEDLLILEREAVDPFAQPVIPLKRVAEYRRGSGPAQRLHVRGAVTLQRAGEGIFLQDDSGGLQISTTQSGGFAIGEQVEAVGFLEFENHLPLLRDAVLRRVPAGPAPIAPRAVPFAELKQGLHHASLITFQGRILDHATRPVSRPAQGFSGMLTTWLLQGEEISFTLEHESAAENLPLASIPLGSLLEFDAVCVSSVDTDGKLQALKLLLPSEANLRVLARPSWFTPRRLLIGFGLLSAVLVGAVAWLLTVSRKNAELRVLIREREKAQRELQEAHDTLEEKVAERSAQLHVEMTGRKTAEVQFKAVLTERTRLARDLHDTLEQTLTGIALQLDTASKLFSRTPEQANHHLQLARNWLRQSQVGLRRSIWDLRSRELEQFDLPSALEQSARQMAEGTDIVLEFATLGERRALPEVVEENVLRIGQEAFTNIAKHAHATRVSILLECTRHALRLRVEDNGLGFDSSAAPSPGENHFGLLGMTERAKRLGGHVTVDSAHGHGTCVVVEIPLEPLGTEPVIVSTEAPPRIQ